MTYVLPNFRTEKELKKCLKEGLHIKIFEPGLGTIPENGIVYLEGPHYPEPHTWYAIGTIEKGKLIRVE
jgi:hypothetical protein